MTMNKVLHRRSDVGRLYVLRKRDWRGLASIEDSIDEWIQRLEDYIEKHRGGQITGTRNNTDNTRISRTELTKKQKIGKKNKCMDVLRG